MKTRKAKSFELFKADVLSAKLLEDFISTVRAQNCSGKLSGQARINEMAKQDCFS